MAKMDEIMEVLTQEIVGFNNSIGKLEELSERFNKQKIQTDTTRLESLLEDFFNAQKGTLTSYEKRTEEVLKKIEKSRWTPKWEVALLYIYLSINTIAFGYLGYYFINYELKIQDAVKEARVEGFGRARQYFNDHPIIYRILKGGPNGRIAFQIKCRAAPYRISSLRLSTGTLKKCNRIRAQVSYGKIWGKPSIY